MRRNFCETCWTVAVECECSNPEQKLEDLIDELRHQTARWKDTTDPTRPLDVPECADELEHILDRYDTEVENG